MPTLFGSVFTAFSAWLTSRCKYSCHDSTKASCHSVFWINSPIIVDNGQFAQTDINECATSLRLLSVVIFPACPHQKNGHIDPYLSLLWVGGSQVTECSPQREEVGPGEQKQDFYRGDHCFWRTYLAKPLSFPKPNQEVCCLKAIRRHLRLTFSAFSALHWGKLPIVAGRQQFVNVAMLRNTKRAVWSWQA